MPTAGHGVLFSSKAPLDVAKLKSYGPTTVLVNDMLATAKPSALCTPEHDNYLCIGLYHSCVYDPHPEVDRRDLFMAILIGIDRHTAAITAGLCASSHSQQPRV